MLSQDDDDGTHTEAGDAADEWMQPKSLVKPDDQLDLSEQVQNYIIRMLYYSLS